MVEVFFGAADSMEEKMGVGWCGRLLGFLAPFIWGVKPAAKAPENWAGPQKGCSSMGPAVSFTTLCIFAFFAFFSVAFDMWCGWDIGIG